VLGRPMWEVGELAQEYVLVLLWY